MPFSGRSPAPCRRLSPRVRSRPTGLGAARPRAPPSRRGSKATRRRREPEALRAAKRGCGSGLEAGLDRQETRGRSAGAEDRVPSCAFPIRPIQFAEAFRISPDDCAGERPRGGGWSWKCPRAIARFDTIHNETTESLKKDALLPGNRQKNPMFPEGILVQVRLIFRL